MKKIRGKKRYFKDLEKRSNLAFHELDFSKDGWFDHYHIHLDFFGIGNKSVKTRREHVKAYVSLYKEAIEKLEKRGKIYQSWLEFDDKNAEMDALFIHTENPHEDTYPVKVENISWNCALPNYLLDLVNEKEFVVGAYQNDSDTIYVVQSKDLETNLKETL